MKAKSLALFVLLVTPVIVVAEEYPEFITMMKVTNQSMSALSKMEKKTGPQAARTAERLGSVYEEMIPFWRQRNAAAAVKTSEEGKAAAAELASAAFAGDAEKADAAFKTIGATCKSCHEARREKVAEGKYRIK
jgi:cytochrome c556